MSLLPSKPDASPPDDAGPRVIGVDSDDADDVLSALSSGTARELLSELHDDPAPPSELADSADTSVQNVKYHLDKLEGAGAIEVVDTAYSEKGREMDVYAPSDQPLVIFAGDDDEGSTLRTALARLLGAIGIIGLASLAIQSVFGESLLPSLGMGADSAQKAPESDGGDGASGGAAPAKEDADSDFDTEDSADSGDTADGADGAQTEEDQLTEEEATDGGDDIGTMDQETTEEETVDNGADGADAGGADGGDADAVDGGTEAVNETVSPDAIEPEGADAVVEGAAALPPGLLFFAGGLFAILVVVAYLHFRG